MRLQWLTGLWLGAALMAQAQATSSTTAAEDVHPSGSATSDDTSVTFNFLSTDSTGSRVYETTSIPVICTIKLAGKTFSDFAHITLYHRESTSMEAKSVGSRNLSDATLNRFELEPLAALRRSDESPNFSTNLVFQRNVPPPFSLDNGTGQIDIFPDRLTNYTEELLFFMIVSDGDNTGYSSPYFAVVNPGSVSTAKFTSDNNKLLSDPEPAKFDPTSSNTDGNSPTTNSANESSATGKPTLMPGQETSDKSRSGGLATGAIAGIAVGAAIALVLVIALAWFLLRRKRRAGSHPTDVSTPLAAGYSGAAGASSREFMGDKEAGAIIAESPESQTYTDQPDPRHSTLSGAAIIGGATAAPANASYTESGHQAYDETVPAGHSPTDQQPPHHSSASGIRGVDSPVPSTNVARHLVDEDMTADEIARLEEEERELDRQIQEAGRRRQ